MKSDLLRGQTALVTGGSGGIGKGIVEHLAASGANVAINYVSDPDAAEEMVRAIQSDGGKAIAVKADVSKESEVQTMFQKVVDEFGATDILVNNAGVQRDSPFAEMTLEQWQTVLNINLTGYFLCAREAVKQFTKQGITQRSRAAGKIICISSVHEKIPWAGHINYASAKGGVRMFVKSLAQEVAHQKIRVNSIAPGAIKTPINESVWGNEESLKELLTLIPYGRIGEPEDVAKAAVWLASDESDYITGTTLFIDGGMMLFPGFIGNG